MPRGQGTQRPQPASRARTNGPAAASQATVGSLPASEGLGGATGHRRLWYHLSNVVQGNSQSRTLTEKMTKKVASFGGGRAVPVGQHPRALKGIQKRPIRSETGC